MVGACKICLSMRVLIVTGSYPPMRCGVGDYSQKLVETLVAYHEIQVGVLTSIAGAYKDESNRIERFPIIEKWELLETFKVIKVIRNWSPDIVHVQYPTQGYKNGLLPWVIPIISYLMGKKVVQTWHEVYSRLNAPRLFFKAIVPSRLIFVREHHVTNLHPQLRWALWGKKTVFIPNASAIPHVELDEHKKYVIKKQYLKKQTRLIVFFGFVYPQKGVELLFKIADPAIDQIVIAGEADKNSAYFHEITKLASTQAWLGKVTITGFLPIAEAAALLAVADAVILPFRASSGEWNTSIHGAVLNGALVITTSLTKSGYDGKRNIYFAKVDNIEEMRLALSTYAGKRREYDADIDVNEWEKIEQQHYSLYKNSLLK